MSSWFEQPMLAYDHSDLAQAALQIFISLKNKFSKSHILHVFNSQKNPYLLPILSASTIEQHLKQKFSPQNKDNTTIELRQQGNKSINQIILQSFISSGTNLLFLGFVGTKGMKPRSKDFSSRIGQFVYESKISLGIIKRKSPQTGNVLFCFDGSQIAISGLRKANEFCQVFEKSLSVIHCTNAELKTHGKHIKNQIKNLKQQQKQLKFQFLYQQQIQLINWIKKSENEWQWIILTSNGYRGQISKMRFIGRKTTKILQQININTLLIKQ